MKIMAANSNLPLARAIAAYLEMPLVDAQVRRFALARELAALSGGRGLQAYTLVDARAPPVEIRDSYSVSTHNTCTHTWSMRSSPEIREAVSGAIESPASPCWA